MHHKNNTEEKGASENATTPKSNTPQEDSIQETKPEEQREVGIGMPVSQEEMERMKEKARRKDN